MQNLISIAPNPGEYNIRNGLQSCLSNICPGTKWFSKDSLDTLGDLLVSMTQYQPRNRPSATQVLQHRWFQRFPSLTTVKHLSEKQEALADLETLKS